METFNFIGTATVFQYKWKSKHSFLSCSEQDHRILPITNARNLSSSFSPQQHPSLANGLLGHKKVLREALQNPLNKLHRHQLVWPNMSFLSYLKKHETNVPLIRLYKTSNSNTNNSPKKNIAHHLFFAIYKSFRTRIHSFSSWMLMQAPKKNLLWFCKG